ncbi:MAG: KEOPS complex kinase/ATPase Bud32 [Nanoarchaeota archaeon]|nr:KEOPS complex kinase/ATPase Bud32 [Nanoarchaeota archaeon]
MEKLSVGAESEIIIIDNKTLRKIRLGKKYRHELLDIKLRRSRTKREYKILEKLHEKNVNIPKPYNINLKETYIDFEYLKGDVLKKVLDKEKLIEAFKQICLLHKQEIVHGDLTTLNMLYANNKVYLIDFGLSGFSDNVEERGVDLNLFFTCIKNEHPNFHYLKEDLLQIYKKELKEGEEVIKRLEEIELRGRNKAKQ